LVDKSVCLLADNVRNEVVAIHKSQEVLKMLGWQSAASDVPQSFAVALPVEAAQDRSELPVGRYVF
jgi:hypothetical protein